MCDHASFLCQGQVNRLIEDDGGPVVGYTVDVRVTCTACQMPFHFLGLPDGVHSTRPTRSADGLEARLPMAPGLRRWPEGACDDPAH